MPRLFLFDGTALAYRSHFALARSGLTTKDGRPTGATYGFTMALRRILENENPDLVAVAFDPPGKTFRHETFGEYKATREKAPEEMRDQLDTVKELVRLHGIPIFEVPGFEADDVIGTLARQAEARGDEVFIVTGDKDFMQCVSDKVRLYNIFKPNVELIIEGPAEVQDKFGTTPDHVVDALAIMGDSSDNVPGVTGIGEKGAKKLIGEFGSVDAILERLDEVKGKAKEHIERDREQLLLSRDLVTIRSDLELDPGLDSIGAPKPDTGKLVGLLQELDFQTIVKKVLDGTERPEEMERDYVTIHTKDELDAMIAELYAAGEFAVDTETTGLFPLEAVIVGVAFCAKAGRAFYVAFNHSPPILEGGPDALLEALAPLLTDPSLKRCGQNYKYDALVFAGRGLDVPPADFDTMLASFCVAGSARRHGLDELALSYFGIKKIPTSEIIGTGKKQVTMAEVMVDQVSEYACEDADITWRLKVELEREVEETKNTDLFFGLEMPLVPVLTNMERRGIRVDTDLLAALGKSMQSEIDAAEKDVQKLAGTEFNVNSTKVLGSILFEVLKIQDEAGVKRPKKTKTGWATDHATLSQHYADVPIIQRLLEYREIAKLKSTYVDTLPTYVNKRTGRIHCSFSQVSAATGRLASSDPNLQNIPVRTERGRKLREAFVPREVDERGDWVLLAADYSQVELRIMAHLSGDRGLADAFAAGDDIHAATAATIFQVDPGEVDRGMRSRAKAINFGLLYGMGPQRLARDTGISVPEAKEFIARYFESFPKVREWIDGVLEGARQNGYVETLLGRRRPTPDINAKDNRSRVFAENAAVNTPVQGSAADIIKRAMIDLEARLQEADMGSQILLQVHDELLLEVPVKRLDETIEMTRDCMENAVVLDVPLKVDFGHGKNWLEAH